MGATYGVKVDPDAPAKEDLIHKMSPTEAKKTEYTREKENQEEILEAGHNSAKRGAREIARQEKLKTEADQRDKEQAVEKLKRKSKTFESSYKRELADYLVKHLNILDWIKGWRAHVLVTDGTPISIYNKQFQTKNGILLIVETAKGNILHQGMLVTGEAPIDMAGALTMCVQMENTLDQAKGLLLDNKPPESDTILDKDGQPIAKPDPTPAA